MSNITLPLATFLDCLIGWRDRAYVGEDLALRIIAADEARLTYVAEEKPDPEKNEKIISGRGRLFVVWRKKEWDTHYEKVLEDRAKAEIRLLEFNKSKALLRKVANVFQKELGMTDDKMSLNMAEKLLRTSETKEKLIEKIRDLIGITIEVKEEDL